MKDAESLPAQPLVVAPRARPISQTPVFGLDLAAKSAEMLKAADEATAAAALGLAKESSKPTTQEEKQ